MELEKEKFEALCKDVGEIKTALLGQPQFKTEGIVSKVERHDAYVKNAKLRLGFLTGASTGLGYALHRIVEYFNH